MSGVFARWQCHPNVLGIQNLHVMHFQYTREAKMLRAHRRLRLALSAKDLWGLFDTAVPAFVMQANLPAPGEQSCFIEETSGDRTSLMMVSAMRLSSVSSAPRELLPPGINDDGSLLRLTPA